MPRRCALNALRQNADVRLLLMSAVKIFRTVVVAELLLTVLAWGLNTEWMHPASPDVALLQWALIVGVWVLMLAASLGMFFFIRAGRILYVVTVLLGVLWLALVGDNPLNPTEAVLSYLSNLCAGAALALSWLSPDVTERFGRKQPNSTVERDAPQAARPSP
jgi:hypothetical protein